MLVITFIATTFCCLVYSSPIQLVRPAASHVNLEVVPEGLQALRSLQPPVAVISVVGAVHSGKSYLLNRLIDIIPGLNTGFPVGYTIRPETSGIWMFQDPIPRQNTTVVYVDTEGFFSPNVTDVYDAKMFAIATLLSSEVIYNTVKFIGEIYIIRLTFPDNHHVELLELLIRRTNLFGLRAYAQNTAAKSNSSSSSLATFLQVLVPSQLSWVIQDFVQDLGTTTAEDWLAELIEKDHGTSRSRGETPVGSFFKNIDCVPLPVPAATSEILQKLDMVDPNALDPVYLKAVATFRNRLLDRAVTNPKCKGLKLSTVFAAESERIYMSGNDLAELLTFLTNAANTGSENPMEAENPQPFPSVPSVAEQFTNLQLNLMKGDIVSILRKDILASVHSAFKSNRPLNRASFDNHFKTAENEALKLWNSTVNGLISGQGIQSGLETARKDLETNLRMVRADALAANIELIEKWCQGLIDSCQNKLLAALDTISNPTSPTRPDILSDLLSIEVKAAMEHYREAMRKVVPIGYLNCCRNSSECKVN